MDQQPSSPGLRPVGLPDYALALLARWRLLLLLPIVVAAIAYGAVKLLPKVYTSVSLVAISIDDQKETGITPALVASIMKSRVVLDPVLAAKVVDVDLEELTSRVNPTVSREGLVRLEAEGDNPEQAQRVAAAVVSAWLKTTVPGERERADLMARAQATKSNLANVQAALDSMTRSLGAGERAPADARVRLADLAETADKLFSALQAVNRRLDGLPVDVVRQPATLPEGPSYPRPLSVAARAWIGTLLLLMAVVVVQRRVQAARTDPVVDAKLRELTHRAKERS